MVKRPSSHQEEQVMIESQKITMDVHLEGFRYLVSFFSPYESIKVEKPTSEPVTTPTMIENFGPKIDLSIEHRQNRNRDIELIFRLKY